MQLPTTHPGVRFAAPFVSLSVPFEGRGKSRQFSGASWVVRTRPPWFLFLSPLRAGETLVFWPASAAHVAPSPRPRVCRRRPSVESSQFHPSCRGNYGQFFTAPPWVAGPADPRTASLESAAGSSHVPPASGHARAGETLANFSQWPLRALGLLSPLGVSPPEALGSAPAPRCSADPDSIAFSRGCGIGRSAYVVGGPFWAPPAGGL